MTLRVVIADDEAPARDKIVRLLAGDARFALAGVAADGFEAVALIQRALPALAILDVQMPGLTGLEVIDALGDACPEIILSTAHERYALAAFDAAAIDYLLKPYDAARFARALDRAHARIAAGARAPELKALVAQRPLERLLVRKGEALVPIRIADVWRLSAEDKHVRLYSAHGEDLVRQSLRAIEARLDPRRFVRVHRGEIVALDAVRTLEPWTHGDALLAIAGGSTVVLSRTFRDAFLARWGEHA
jgi:two-component system, LytTR family, response regulator